MNCNRPQKDPPAWNRILPNKSDIGLQFSVTPGRAGRWKSTDISEEHVSPTLKMEATCSYETSVESILKMEAACFCETPVVSQRTTRLISQRIKFFIIPSARTWNPDVVGLYKYKHFRKWILISPCSSARCEERLVAKCTYVTSSAVLFNVWSRPRDRLSGPMPSRQMLGWCLETGNCHSNKFLPHYSEIIQAFSYISASCWTGLIHRTSLGAEISWHVGTLVVCYVVLYFSCLFCDMFRPYKAFIRQIMYVVAAVLCFL
jgi:hypothetical protein